MKSKRKFFLLFTFLIFFPVHQSFAQIPSHFNEPWKKPKTAIVIDAYHKNEINWNELKTDKRLVGILHKATEGTDFSDPKYLERRSIAKKEGYRWGSFHLLRKGEPEKQAEFYLDRVGLKIREEVLALDVECTVNSQCAVPKYRVSAEEIKIFLRIVRQKTGRYPILYANNSVVSDLSINYGEDELLSKVPLWYARFKPQVSDFPTGIWKTYSFWQFSSEINCRPDSSCLYRVPGTLFDMDINVFNGSVDELKKQWSRLGK